MVERLTPASQCTLDTGNTMQYRGSLLALWLRRVNSFTIPMSDRAR